MLLAYAISHYLFPGYSNNQKAKILHSSTIFVFIFSLIVYQIVLQFIPISGVRILGYAANIPVNEVVALTNQKRIENGLDALKYNELLSHAAQAKGKDMLEKDYWAHVAPDGTSPWKFFIDAGYKYRFAGENLARDFSNAQSAVDAWMASPSHRDNLLSPKYKEVGIAVVEGDMNGVETTIVVQLFGTSYADTVPVVPVASAKTSAVGQPVVTTAPTPTFQPTPTPTKAPSYLAFSESPAETVSVGGGVVGTNSKAKVLISPFNTTKNISILTVMSLLSIMVIDAIITHKRKVTRIGGRTFAHLAFLGMIVAIALIAKAGAIL